MLDRILNRAVRVCACAALLSAGTCTGILAFTWARLL